MISHHVITLRVAPGELVPVIAVTTKLLTVLISQS
jgi:hypothetical protein